MAIAVLEVNNLSKTFPGVRALNKVSLKLYKGEIHALVGENGAGKSTLTSIISGVIKPDSGQIYVSDKIVKIKNPFEAIKLGIRTVHQELSLVSQMSVAENIFLGKETKKNLIFLDKKQMYEDTKKELKKIDFNIDPFVKVGLLTLAERQMVEIARNIASDAKILILDEPTSSLSIEEVQKLFRTLEELKNKKISIIFISHEIEEIFEIADRITILRNGKNIKTVENKKITKNELLNIMAGREINFDVPKKKTYPWKARATLLKIENLRNKSLKNMSFSLFEGEVLSILGLVGSGKTELARAIFGLDKIESGGIFLNGKKIEITTPLQAINNGIAYATEDRNYDGLFLKFSVRDNISIVVMKKFAKIFGYRNKKAEGRLADDFRIKLSIKFYNMDQEVETLSGGNRQKVVLSKWIATKSKILMLDEPTRGVDVATRQELYNILKNSAKENNIGIIVFTSDIFEAMAVSDRILISRKGKLTLEVSTEEMNYQNLLGNMTKKEV